MTDEKKSSRGGLKRAVADAAPQLARALGGPLAGAAASAISRAVLGRDGADNASLEAALAAATPEQLLALRRADNEFQAALRAAQVETARLDANDRAGARARQQAMDDWTPSALGAVIIIGFFVVMAAMVSRSLPHGMENELSIMLGALATMTAAVVNYFFGSSAGSKEKTRLIATSHREGEGE